MVIAFVSQEADICDLGNRSQSNRTSLPPNTCLAFPDKSYQSHHGMRRGRFLYGLHLLLQISS